MSQRQPTSEKPAYRVPSMEEINALPWNGLSVATTFAGAGGSSLGYRMAGFRVLYANEFVEAARDTYEANKREWTIVDGRDIRTVTPESFLETIGLARGELDLLDGSPPCASFSTAGKRSAKWGQVSSYSDTAQRTDDLFYEFARILEGVQPKVFIAENVSGLVKGVAKGYFKAIMKRLGECGYRVECQLLDAQWLGVPQSRQRVIIQGVRNDLDRAPAYPVPFQYRYSLREALEWGDKVVVSGSEGRAFGRSSTGEVDIDEPSPIVGAGGMRAVGANEVAVVDRQVIHDTGGNKETTHFSAGEITDKPVPAITTGVGSLNSQHFRVHEQVLVHDTSRPNVPAREVADEPSPTITTGHGNSGHYKVIQREMGSAPATYREVETGVPAPTVMAHGAGGVHDYQVAVIARDRNEGHWEGRTIEVDVDAPSPIVNAEGIKGVGPAQFALITPTTDEDGHVRDPETGERIDLVDTAIGREWHNMVQGEKSDRYLNLVRSREDHPLQTVTAIGGGRGTAAVTMPAVCRKFTLGELRRLCSFPDDFVLTGTYAQRWERLGRAVPPLMMFAVAREVRDRVLS